ncbi:hypothetical protein KUL156_10180 [Alteromonas sp. KUL156]|nr:hypothetical protein KUL154_28700 [Alteromonas sp. KUL154]GFD98425.1 hypothetical protein KUL156_10180 [Alteromonas sp. KUL156]
MFSWTYVGTLLRATPVREYLSCVGVFNIELLGWFDLGLINKIARYVKSTVLSPSNFDFICVASRFKIMAKMACDW